MVIDYKEDEPMMVKMSPATLAKRNQLAYFIQRKLAPEPAVQGVVAIGSLVSGLARSDSDIDAVLFLEPYDDYIAPAEAIWRPSDDSFYSIFSQETGLKEEGIQIDFARLALAQWSDPDFSWPEGRRAELSQGWIAFDRDGRVGQLIAERTRYDHNTRMQRLDEAITWMDQHLGGKGPQVRWESLEPLIAHDRLQAAYEYLVQAFFAYNRRWRPWRNREMSALLKLPWLPEAFHTRLLYAANAPSLDYLGYMQRVENLRELFDDVLARLVADGDYGDDPIGEAFIRDTQEPGRAWNMDEWNRIHRQRNAGKATT